VDLEIARWQWDEGSLIGESEMDADHRHFGLLVRDLDRAVAAGANDTILEDQIRLIAHDALLHFDKEDALHTRYGYPPETSTRKLHNEIGAILRSLLRKDRDSLAIDGAAGRKWSLPPAQLKVLLVSHLIYEDAAFRDFLTRERTLG